jgi:hypothetical protein
MREGMALLVERDRRGFGFGHKLEINNLQFTNFHNLRINFQGSIFEFSMDSSVCWISPMIHLRIEA